MSIRTIPATGGIFQAYFRSYARTFGVYERIRFNHVVKKILRLP